MKKTIVTLFALTLFITTINAQSYPELIKVTGGTFTMGDNLGLGQEDEQPTHEVALKDFYIGKTEVTVAQYRNYCNATGVSMPDEPSWGWNSSDPIVNVNWNDALNYCDWLSEKLDKNITLPTEAQWEFAARGGNQSKGKYTGGRSMATAGWYGDNSGNKAHTVATKKANELGLYDMSGNIWEWCLDWYKSDYYAISPSKNPKNTARGYYRVIRGGSWISNASNCRVANRSYYKPSFRYIYYGFRVVSF
ncbi:MAG: formylglycine-generating enzyme family protein [Bacteroidetes bacterium]|nr:formylglycine-generating enzyme family protein [Bacteroidota bacterium]